MECIQTKRADLEKIAGRSTNGWWYTKECFFDPRYWTNHRKDLNPRTMDVATSGQRLGMMQTKHYFTQLIWTDYYGWHTCGMAILFLLLDAVKLALLQYCSDWLFITRIMTKDFSSYRSFRYILQWEDFERGICFYCVSRILVCILVMKWLSSLSKPIIHCLIGRLHGLGMKTMSGSTSGAEIDNETSNRARMLLRILFRSD